MTERCPTCGLAAPGPEHRAYEPLLCSDTHELPQHGVKVGQRYMVPRGRGHRSVGWVTKLRLEESPTRRWVAVLSLHNGVKVVRACTTVKQWERVYDA